MADSLFDQTDTNFDQNKDYLEELIGPGGKFDVTKYNNNRDEAIKAMAKGKAFADKTLEHKLREFDELREAFIQKSAEADAKASESEAKAKFEELVTRYENSLKAKDTDDTQKPGPVVQPFDPSQIETVVTNKIQEIEQRRREQENLTRVNSRLKERFGENAQNVLKDKMNTLGLTQEDIDRLAKRSPEAFFNTIGLNQQQTEQFQSPPRNSVRSDNFSPQTNVRDAVYYEKMRKEDPKKYFSPDVSVQRLKDMDSPEFLKRYSELHKTN